MAQSRKWTVGEKIIFTILLAVLFSALFGCAAPQTIGDRPAAHALAGDADAAYVRGLYPVYNARYFGGHLPTDTVFNYELGADNIAETRCLNDDGTGCTISFNEHFAAAQRTAETTLLHEMCHIKVWKTHLLKDKPALDDENVFYHNKSWQTCMLVIDMQGAFREINIDYYTEAN